MPTKCCVSRKYTFATDSMSETPNANRNSSAITTTTAGVHSSDAAPPSRVSATSSTTISMDHENTSENAFDSGSAARGNATFLMRFSLPTREPMPPFSTLTKKPPRAGARRAGRPRSCAAPEGGLPVGIGTRSTNEKTAVKISICASGFTSDQS